MPTIIRTKSYKVVGWYVPDGMDPNSEPFSRVVTVKATDRQEAFALGAAALGALHIKEKSAASFLNWFVEVVKTSR